MNAIDLLLTQLDEAYDRRSWHGTNLRGSIRRITPSFPVRGSNWFPRLRVDEKAWRDDIGLLDDAHRRLRLLIADLDLRRLEQTPRGRSVSNRAMLSGIIAHDLYHAGQIQLLKRLTRRST